MKQVKNIDEVIVLFEEQLRAAGAPPGVIAQVDVAADEIFSNITRYSGAESAAVGCRVEGHKVVLRFADDGKPYDPTRRPEPELTASVKERKIGGLGIFMVKKMMNRVEYRYSGGYNILELEKEW